MLDPDNWRSYDPNGFTPGCALSDGSTSNWVCVVVGVGVFHIGYTLECPNGLGSSCSTPNPAGGMYVGTCCSSLY